MRDWSRQRDMCRVVDTLRRLHVSMLADLLQFKLRMTLLVVNACRLFCLMPTLVWCYGKELKKIKALRGSSLKAIAVVLRSVFFYLEYVAVNP